MIFWGQDISNEAYSTHREVITGSEYILKARIEIEPCSYKEDVLNAPRRQVNQRWVMLYEQARFYLSASYAFPFGY